MALNIYVETQYTRIGPVRTRALAEALAEENGGEIVEYDDAQELPPMPIGVTIGRQSEGPLGSSGDSEKLHLSILGKCQMCGTKLVWARCTWHCPACGWEEETDGRASVESAA